jgi:hypothetical protein
VNFWGAIKLGNEELGELHVDDELEAPFGGALTAPTFALSSAWLAQLETPLSAGSLSGLLLPNDFGGAPTPFE